MADFEADTDTDTDTFRRSASHSQGGNNGDNRDERYYDELKKGVYLSSDERCRKISSMRKMVLETIHVLFKEYGVDNLYHIRKKVETAQTEEEMRLAADMLLTIGRFHATG